MYTHISTPRQSYADLLVQRQLITAIEGQTWKISDIETAELLEGCNKAKLISQHIQAGCEKVFLCLYLRANPVFTKAVVMSI
jgi:DIS3-like exonuclease 2